MKSVAVLVLIIVLGIISTIVSCSSNETVVEYVTVKDTVVIQDSAAIIKAQNDIKILQDSVSQIRDSLNLVNSNLRESLFVSNYKLARVEYYIKVVDNKSSNLKYLKGWLKRVLKD